MAVEPDAAFLTCSLSRDALNRREIFFPEEQGTLNFRRFAFALFCCLFVLAGGLGFADPPVRGGWWLPPSVSTFAPKIDAVFYAILWITMTAFVLVEVGIVYFVIKFRARDGVRARYVHGNHKLEIIWTAVPAIILVVLSVASQNLWSAIKYPANAPTNGVRIEVLAEQFAWNVRYPGPDGKFGKLDATLVGQENPWRRVEGDADGKDDVITLNQMHVPVNEPILVLLRSKDVIHSFFLPEFRVKQDAVPGMNIHTWFQATKPGDYEITCAQFCGLGHYRMRGFITVDTREDFEKWLKEQAGQ